MFHLGHVRIIRSFCQCIAPAPLQAPYTKCTLRLPTSHSRGLWEVETLQGVQLSVCEAVKLQTLKACNSVSGRHSPCNSGIIGIKEDPNIVRIIHYGHYYWVGGAPKLYKSELSEFRSKNAASRENDIEAISSRSRKK